MKKHLLSLLILLVAQTSFAEMNRDKRLFPDIPLVGEQSETDVKDYLNEIKDTKSSLPEPKVDIIKSQINKSIESATSAERPDKITNGAELFQNESKKHFYNFWRKTPPPWKYTQYQIGFITNATGNYQNIKPAHQVKSESLNKINIKLDKLRIFDYPGNGMHNILFTFKASNAVTNAKDEVIAFNQAFQAAETNGVGIVGYPIFYNINVPKNGVDFHVAITNVSNSADEKALKILDSNETKAGLALLTTAQPAVAPFTEIALGISKMILSRNQNKLVQDVFIGLDSDNNAAAGARLAEGNYIVIQAPDDTFSWSNWIYDNNNSRIVSNSDHSSTPDYNYFIFRITKAE